MSDNEEKTTTITAFGSVDRETKNAIRYNTSWGVVYIPKAQLDKLEGGQPANIRITVEAQV